MLGVFPVCQFARKFFFPRSSYANSVFWTVLLMQACRIPCVAGSFGAVFYSLFTKLAAQFVLRFLYHALSMLVFPFSRLVYLFLLFPVAALSVYNVNIEKCFIGHLHIATVETFSIQHWNHQTRYWTNICYQGTAFPMFVIMTPEFFML